ncbi:hypothetical protein M2109_001802 [Paenibacillus sp. PastH-3]|nr:hypothetical protein [Paenibacillus sp. PastH-4]MDH6441794.1 hypothetical protein [Paenibacillus sp. PastF-4]MDH6527491.1 hypothetical protein [Paenibacillus sp. PastH-3]
MRLIKGQKVDITKGRNVNKLLLKFGWMTADTRIGIDSAAFYCQSRTVANAMRTLSFMVIRCL